MIHKNNYSTNTAMQYEFRPFANVINNHFIQLSKDIKGPSSSKTPQFYVTSVSKDEMYHHYLNSFPDGTNPVHRTRREYDCSCCKQFIRNIGNVVTIKDRTGDGLEMVSVWDVEGLSYPYDVVAKAMSAYVKSQPIASIFRVKETMYGAPDSKELVTDSVHTWHHFYGKIQSQYLTSTPEQEIGESNSNMQVMRRGLTELSLSAINLTLELIDSNSVYRGAEQAPALRAFKTLKEAYDASNNKELFLWSNTHNRNGRLRNSAIGTLVVDLSEGVDVTEAVHSFGSKMDGYKRPKNTIITPSMTKAAVKTIQELGIEASLSRRFARISDVSVNDVLYVDNAVRGQMRDGNISALLMSQSKGKTPDLSKATAIGISEFMRTVVPTVTSMEVLFDNKHLGNLVSLTAPIDADAPGIFKWGNNFAWSYKGNTTDSSIKQRVKAAGGNVTAPLRVSLAWYNTDDLDLHVHEPNGNHIFYRNKCGKLDLDMNVSNPVCNAVENVCWLDPTGGVYKVKVYNHNRRDSIDVGFTLEVESMGEIKVYHHTLPVSNIVDSLTMQVKDGKVVSITPCINVEAGNSSNKEWGIKTQTLVKVDSIVLSPNHWSTGDAMGNKHWFFILNGCINPDPTRGIYGEYLRGDLHEKHGKVFEVLGDLTKCPHTTEQLSGVGFSSTRKDKVKLLVHTSTSRKAYEVCF